MKFVKSATEWDQFPDKHLPEVGIVGRSNSGKSSLINALARQTLAKVSQKPGKTRLLNIFDYDRKCYLVDMPGYGFASRSASERRSWEKMIENYLNSSERLVGLILLMDIRRSWSEDEDLLWQYCHSQDLPIVVGLTKADKLSRSRWNSAVIKFKKDLKLPAFAVSSEKKWGVNEILGFALKEWVFPLKG